MEERGNEAIAAMSSVHPQQGLTISSPQWERLLFLGAWGLFALALLLGGGQKQGLAQDAAIQLASLPVLFVVAMVLSARGLSRWMLWPLILSAAIVVTPLIQLIPLPPAIWHRLPGRAPFAETYDLIGAAQPFLPISLDPAATWRTFYGLLPSLALFWAFLLLDERSIRRFWIFLVIFACVSVVLGLAQLAFKVGGLRMFGGVSDEALGFMSGRNNLGALLYASVPAALAWVGTSIAERRLHSLAVAVGAVLLLVLGLLTARSRAGLGLGVLAGGSMAAYVMLPYLRARAWWQIILGLAVLLLVFVVILDAVFFRILPRFSPNISDDLRWPMARISLGVGWQFFPVGSGFGTFVPVFMIFEPSETLGPFYVNHAHNDYLELLMEGGAVAAAVVALAVGFIFYRAIDALFVRGPGGNLFVVAAAAVVLALLVHSALEYPLRLHALAAVMVLACATLSRGPMPVRLKDRASTGS